MNNRFTKKNLILLIIASIMVTAIVGLAIFNWDFVFELMKDLITGTEIVKEFVVERGILGKISIIIIIIICYFFPVVSSTPVQVISGISYGLIEGTLIVSLAIAIASQLLYLFKQNAKILYSEAKLKKQKELREKIANSKLGITKALIIAYIIPFIPFLVISNMAASGLSYKKYLLYTTIGPIPEVFVTLYFGRKLLTTSPIASVITLVLLIIVVVLSIVFNDKMLEWIFKPRKEVTDEKQSN